MRDCGFNLDKSTVDWEASRSFKGNINIMVVW